MPAIFPKASLMVDWLRYLGRWLLQLDRDLTSQFRLPLQKSAAPSPLSLFAHVGAHLGDSLLWVTITGLLWWHAGADEKRRYYLLGWLISVVATLIATLAIKRIFKRQRPGVGTFLYGRGADVHSFPSGHASRVGVILTWASILAPGWGRWSPLLALWISWSRVAVGVHYVSDVLVGLLLGLGIGGWMRTRWK